jgi:hypothetical protein
MKHISSLFLLLVLAAVSLLPITFTGNNHVSNTTLTADGGAGSPVPPWPGC